VIAAAPEGQGTAPAPTRTSSEASGSPTARLDPETRQSLNGMMVRLADGDRSGFDGAYALLWPALLAFCKRALPPSDAEDAAQLALLKVFERASTFQRDKDALTWAITIAVWEVRTIHKRQIRSRSTSIDADQQLSSADDPERAVTEHELVEAAQAVLGSLSDDDRATLIATFAEEPPAGVPGATFRKRRERAMARLKEAWRTIHGD
jgi:RNA polymerase sigma factor (sigma-70 family)